MYQINRLNQIERDIKNEKNTRLIGIILCILLGWIGIIIGVTMIVNSNKKIKELKNEKETLLQVKKHQYFSNNQYDNQPRKKGDVYPSYNESFDNYFDEKDLVQAKRNVFSDIHNFDDENTKN